VHRKRKLSVGDETKGSFFWGLNTILTLVVLTAMAVFVGQYFIGERMVDEARVVVAVWKTGSLTQAALLLNVSLPTVSRRLTELERTLGVVLFERTTRSLRATSAGEELARRLEPGLELLDVAMRRVHDDSQEAAGLVRLSVPPNLSSILGPILASFRTLHPKVRLQVEVTDRRLHYAAEDVDVLLRVGRLVEENLVAKPLHSYSHILCACPESAAKIQNPNDLRGAELALWGRGEFDREITLLNQTQTITLAVQPSMLTNDYGLLAAIAADGGIVAELPSLVAAAWLQSGRLVRVLPDWRLSDVTLSILYAPRLLSTSVRLLVDHVRASFQNKAFLVDEGE
jgi:DNA-binding transcriptional LysR family regulator